MDKTDFTQQFAMRLRNTMIDAGYHSQRSVSGVDIQKLAEITGYSPQICRKYLRGLVIPEPVKLSEIAEKLHVSPGWLLYGDDAQQDNEVNKRILIHEQLLHYIFTQAQALYQSTCAIDDLCDFLLDVTRDVSHINATEAQSKKIIDLAMASASHFKPK